MFKKIFTLFIAAALLTSCTIPASATLKTANADSLPSANWSLKTFPSGEKYLYNENTGDTVVKAFCYTQDGEFVELTLQEYLQIKNSVPYVATNPEHDTNNICEVAAVSSTWYYDYREARAYVGQGDPCIVSSDVRGPGTIQHTQSATIEHSFGGSATIDGTTKNLIQLGASFDWHTSLASETSNSYTFDVPSGNIGYIQFTPYLNITEGDLYMVSVLPGIIDETYMGEAWGASPIKTSGGFAYGIFELMLK